MHTCLPRVYLSVGRIRHPPIYSVICSLNYPGVLTECPLLLGRGDAVYAAADSRLAGEAESEQTMSILTFGWGHGLQQEARGDINVLHHRSGNPVLCPFRTAAV